MLLDKEIHIRTEDFHLYTKNQDEEVHVHCLVDNWSLSVLKELYQKVGALKNILMENNVEVVYSISPNPNFCKLFGGSSIATAVDRNGRILEVMVWVLK